MTRISSRATFWVKRVLPTVWFGFLALTALRTLAAGRYAQDALMLVGLVVLAIAGFVLIKELLWNLADEVYDLGDRLVVRNAGDEETIELSNVMNVNVSSTMNPRRITLRLVTPVKFGSEIVFSSGTGFTLNPFAKNKTAEDLMLRAYRARTQRAD